MGRKLCVLCGAEPGEAGEYLGVYSEYQLFCSGCAARYREAGEPERRELRGQIAVSPNASRGKIMQQKHAQALECISDLLCPACGTSLELRRERLTLGRRDVLLAPWYNVDLFACPRCGRVELYTAGTHKKGRPAEELESPRPSEPPEDDPGLPAAPPEAVCPQCGTALENGVCPACTRKKEDLFGFGRRKDSRPPWEK